MIISDSKKFMYVHIYKTGGSSTTDFLIPYVSERFCKRKPRKDGLKWQQTWHIGKQHETLVESLPKLEKMGVDPKDYFIFTIVRNPYAWILSVWNNFYSQPYKRKHGGMSGNLRFIAKKIFKSWTQDLFQNHAFYADFPNGSFKEFLLFIDRINRSGSNREKGFWGAYDQYSFLENNRGIKFDFVGKLENLEEDMDYLADKLNLRKHSKIPHRTFKENKIVRQKYLDFYDSESIGIVNKIFSRDFEMFGYSQIEPSSLSDLTRQN